MRKQKTVFIEGFTYEITQLGAVEGRELVILFSQLFGRVFGRLAPFLGVVSKKAKPKAEDAAQDTAPPPTMDADAILAIGDAINSIDAKQLEPLWDAFAKCAWVLGKDGKSRQQVSEVFNDHFAGEYFAMTLFFVESAKLNFADFLAKAFAQADALKGPDPTP